MARITMRKVQEIKLYSNGSVLILDPHDKTKEIGKEDVPCHLPRVNAGADSVIHKKAVPSLLDARKKIGNIQPSTAAITRVSGWMQSM